MPHASRIHRVEPADALLTAGHKVRVLDNFSTGHRRNLPKSHVEPVEGDLRSFGRFSTAMRGQRALSEPLG